LTRVDSERRRLQLSTHYRMVNRRWERISSGDLAWCGTLYRRRPTPRTPRCRSQYEDFVLAPATRAKVTTRSRTGAPCPRRLEPGRELEGVREVRITGPGTDLRLVVEAGVAGPVGRKHNMPDGEVFTSPVEKRDEARSSSPSRRSSREQEVENVRLRFADGAVVHAEATQGQEYLRSLLDTDSGSKVLGEVAFGLNYEIDRFTRDILFDEKIGGTMHVALGGGFDEAGTENKSDLHWDLICDLREEGEVYADGELVWKAGSFLSEPEPAVERV
jgi:aminopeptidase